MLQNIPRVFSLLQNPSRVLIEYSKKLQGLPPVGPGADVDKSKQPLCTVYGHKSRTPKNGGATHS